jgi:hypothetical protein
VLDWLEKHGEVFLRKNVGIGRNLAKSRAYQKSHETFEGVVQVGVQATVDTSYVGLHTASYMRLGAASLD